MRKLSGKQQRAIEKITGKHCSDWDESVLRAYFKFTDTGDNSLIEQLSDNPQMQELLDCHRFHAVTVETWKKDFKSGLLFIDDFLDSPKGHLTHVLEVYRSVFGWIPSRYSNVCLELNVERWQ